MIQERMVLKKNLPATAAITLDFTIPQQIHNCPRADGIKKNLPATQQVPSTPRSPLENPEKYLQNALIFLSK